MALSLEEEEAEAPPLAELLAAALRTAHSQPQLLPAACDALLAAARAPAAAAPQHGLAQLLCARLRQLSALDAAQPREPPAPAPELAAAAHACLLLLAEEAGLRGAAAAEGLAGVLLALLERAAPPGAAAQPPPRWAPQALLCLELLAARGAGAEPLLTADEETRGAAAALAMLRAAAAAAQPDGSCYSEELGGCAHAALLLAARLAARHACALQLCGAASLPLLLRLPPPLLFPGLEPLLARLLRRALEDGATLRGAMEAEVRGALAQQGALRPGGRVQPRALLQQLAPVAARDPAAFADALAAVARLDESGGRPMLLPQPAPRRPSPRAPPAFAAVVEALLALVTDCPGAEDDCAQPMEEDGAAERLGARELACARAAFALRLLTDFLLMYGATAGCVLRRDGEAAAAGAAARAPLQHLLLTLLPRREKAGALAGRVSDRAAVFLLALCVRSAEGRRRVLAAAAAALQAQRPARGAACPPLALALADLSHSLLSRRAGSGGAGEGGISAELVRAMREARLLPALAAALRCVDLEHPDAAGAAAALLRPMEALARLQTQQAAAAAARDGAAAAAAAPAPGVQSPAAAPTGTAEGPSQAGAAAPPPAGVAATPARPAAPPPPQPTPATEAAPLAEQVRALLQT